MRLRHVACVIALFLTVFSISVRAQQDVQPEVPFVPTPENVVAEMLKLADLKNGDFLIDLGSGDGRIVITAAQKYKVKGIGVDINPERIKEANENARKAAVTDMVAFHENDLFKENISKASVVTLYLLPDVNIRLRPKLLKELKPGSRIVSHDFDMGSWKPLKTVELDGHRVYFWVIPPDGPEKEALMQRTEP